MKKSFYSVALSILFGVSMQTSLYAGVCSDGLGGFDPGTSCEINSDCDFVAEIYPICDIGGGGGDITNLPTVNDITVNLTSTTDQHTFTSAELNYQDLDGDTITAIVIQQAGTLGKFYFDANSNGLYDSGEEAPVQGQTGSNIQVEFELGKLKYVPNTDLANTTPTQDGTGIVVYNSAGEFVVSIVAINIPATEVVTYDPIANCLTQDQDVCSECDSGYTLQSNTCVMPNTPPTVTVVEGEKRAYSGNIFSTELNIDDLDQDDLTIFYSIERLSVYAVNDKAYSSIQDYNLTLENNGTVSLIEKDSTINGSLLSAGTIKFNLLADFDNIYGGDVYFLVTVDDGVANTNTYFTLNIRKNSAPIFYESATVTNDTTIGLASLPVSKGEIEYLPSRIEIGADDLNVTQQELHVLDRNLDQTMRVWIVNDYNESLEVTFADGNTSLVLDSNTLDTNLSIKRLDQNESLMSVTLYATDGIDTTSHTIDIVKRNRFAVSNPVSINLGGGYGCLSDTCKTYLYSLSESNPYNIDDHRAANCDARCNRYVNDEITLTDPDDDENLSIIIKKIAAGTKLAYNGVDVEVNQTIPQSDISNLNCYVAQNYALADKDISDSKVSLVLNGYKTPSMFVGGYYNPFTCSFDYVTHDGNEEGNVTYNYTVRASSATLALALVLIALFRRNFLK